MFSRRSIDDYAGEHRPTGPEEGAPLHDLTGGGVVYPDDVYSSKGVLYYGTGDGVLDRQAFAIANRMKGRPNAKVTVYRAVPMGSTERLADIEYRMKRILKRGSRDPGEYDRLATERDQFRAASAEEARRINPGDWVTITKQYAKDHGESALRGEYTLLSAKVKASDIFTNGDSIHEWGYWPDGQRPDFDILYSRRSDTDLAYLLGEPGQVPHIGTESGARVEDGIAKYVSPAGSTRYVRYVGGAPVAALQVMSRDGRVGTIANVFTDTTGRRKGYATELLRQAGVAASWVHDQSYRGTGSVDFLVIEREGNLRAIVCEVNARVTGATYPALLARHFNPGHCWIMRNIRFRRPVESGELLSLMDTTGLLYTPGATNGILPFNFNTNAEGRVIKGQFVFVGETYQDCVRALTHAESILHVGWEYDRD